MCNHDKWKVIDGYILFDIKFKVLVNFAQFLDELACNYQKALLGIQNIPLNEFELAN